MLAQLLQLYLHQLCSNCTPPSATNSNTLIGVNVANPEARVLLVLSVHVAFVFAIACTHTSCITIAELNSEVM